MPVAVRFAVLGDVEARVDGELVDLGHARQRCVLVALLVDAGRAVSAETLAERVWGDRLPARAERSLASYVSRLRGALAGQDGVGIVRRQAGYVLTTDPESVDLYVFRRLTGQARSAEADDAAVTWFDEALALWRGEAFGGLDTPWVNAMRATLDQERLAAELDRNDAELLLGRHHDVLARVSVQASEHPWDERCAGQLMLVLYRCGRQAEALECFRQVRSRLAEQFGVDPGPALQNLHFRILNADPDLEHAFQPDETPAVPSKPATVMGRLVPSSAQLPPDLRVFAGRADELRELDGRLTSGMVLVMSGTAGVGKTTLAVHWAHRIGEGFPDGQLYVNLRGFDPKVSPVPPADAVRRFLDAFGVPPQRVPPDFEAQLGLYRSLMAGKRILVVLDNARDAEQVRPLLPGTPDCLVIVTSRDRLSGLIIEGAHPLSLDLPSVDEARDMLANRLGRERVAAEPHAVDEIIALCARLPLALAVVAARAANHTTFGFASLADELRETRGSLDNFSGTDPATDPRAVFSWSYHQQTPQAASLFRLLGLHFGPDIALPAVASLAGLPPARVRPLLAELSGAHLIIEHSPGRYRLHGLLRAYAAELATTTDSEDRRHDAVHRVLDHYLHTARTAALVLQPTREIFAAPPLRRGVTPELLADQGQALAWFTAEHAVLLTVVDHTVQSGADTYTWQLACALADFLDWRGHWHDEMAGLEAALKAAQRLADTHKQASAHQLLARPHIYLNQLDSAFTHLGHALDLYRRHGDRAGQAHTHTVLSFALERQGDHEAALRQTELALSLYQAIDHKYGQARSLNNLGWSHAHLGNHEQTLVLCRQALRQNQEVGSQRLEALTWDSLGYAHHHLGHHAEAVTCYRRALDLFRDIGNPRQEALALIRLGETHEAAGDLESADTAWRQGLAILNKLDYAEDQPNHPDTELVRTKLGELHRTS